jgi:protein-tyrosine phosphatase
MLRGAPNFRDLGGLRTGEGRTIGHRHLLRSGQLGELHAQDIALLRGELGTDLCVIDLRGAAERMKLPCALPQATVHSLPIEPTVAEKLDAAIARGEPPTVQAAQHLMAEAYRNFVRNARTQVGAVFEHVVARAGKPLLVHCTAGKDRTGFTVAMLLGALGVPRDSIMDDYLLTNRCVAPRESGRYPVEILQVLGLIRAEYLEAAFDVIDHEFGGLDAYLHEAAAVTPQCREALWQALLTP